MAPKIKFLMSIIFIVIIPFCVKASESVEVKVCLPGSSVNECIDSLESGVVQLVPGIYLTNGIKLKSNITLNIPKDTYIKLSDRANLNDKAFGGVANAVILVKGTQKNPLTNVHILLNGTVDGNMSSHPYDKGGCEGINFAWIENSSIRGKGIIKSANGDGIDIDAAKNVVIEGVTVKNNGGSGIHFGSPRPIYGSLNNVVLNVKAYGNGFERKRNGFDLSWPNPHGAVFINNYAENNYRNFEIEASGGIVINCTSVDTGKVVNKDDFSGAIYAYVNGEDVSNPVLISKKARVLIKRDVKKLLGIQSPAYLEGIEY